MITKENAQNSKTNYKDILDYINTAESKGVPTSMIVSSIKGLAKQRIYKFDIMIEEARLEEGVSCDR